MQELEESGYWLDLLIEGNFEKEAKLNPLCEETKELIAILVTMVVNTKAKMSKK